MIDMHAFTSIWYWLCVFGIWAIASHWIIGVPFDMIMRVRFGHEEAASDVVHLTHINARRLVFLHSYMGLWGAALTGFLLSLLGSLAVIYNLEMAQSLLFVFLPLLLVYYLNLRAAREVLTGETDATSIARGYFRLRIWIQLIAAVSIFCSAAFGMYVALMRPIGF